MSNGLGYVQSSSVRVHTAPDGKQIWLHPHTELGAHMDVALLGKHPNVVQFLEKSGCNTAPAEASCSIVPD